MKKMLVVVLATVFALVGCQGTNMNNTTNKDKTRPENTTYEQTRYNDQNVTHNERFTEMRNREDRVNRQDERKRTDYRVSKEAAERITSEVDEISSAYVITTRNNAYVAAILKDRDNRDGRDGENVDRTRAGNQDNITNQNNRDNRDNRSNRADGVFEDGDDLSEDVKNKVANIVQSVDSNIDNVYVTTSPDFVDLSERYANDLDAGRPVRGFFDQIGNAIERIFPQDRGNFTR